MKRSLFLFSITIYSIFLGSQITEGCLLVPYWKSLSTTAFYAYYAQFGLIIGRFYTILTILAALIPTCISLYCFYKRSKALTYSLVSSVFTFLCIALVFIYFKDTNQQFYDAAFTPTQLKSELETWGYWHWLRVLFEFMSLLFLILTLDILIQKNSPIEA